VQVIVDVSPSMYFGRPHSKLSVAADFVESLGYSSFGYGDALGMLAFDHEPREELTFPPRSARGGGVRMAEALRTLDPRDSDAGQTPSVSLHTLSACAVHASPGTSLVFLVSDFHWPLVFLESMLDQLRHVMLVPIVVWHRHETHPPDALRWLRTRDSESGKPHNLFLRTATRKRWRENVSQRRADIHKLFTDHDINPFFMEQGFDAERLSSYFMETAL
jgi:hypothetical protein